MAAYLRVYDSRHLQADCQEAGSAPEPNSRQPSMGYFFIAGGIISTMDQTYLGLSARWDIQCPN